MSWIFGALNLCVLFLPLQSSGCVTLPNRFIWKVKQLVINFTKRAVAPTKSVEKQEQASAFNGVYFPTNDDDNDLPPMCRVATPHSPYNAAPPPQDMLKPRYIRTKYSIQHPHTEFCLSCGPRSYLYFNLRRRPRLFSYTGTYRGFIERGQTPNAFHDFTRSMEWVLWWVAPVGAGLF